MQELKKYELNSVLVLKKGHPCGTNSWQVIRLGADIKLRCQGCNREIMVPRIELNKKIKKVLNEE